MDRGLLAVMAISDGFCLTVLAASSCDVEVVAYGMTVLVTRAGDILTPSLQAELQAALRHEHQHPHGGRSRIAGRRASRTAGSQQQPGQAA
jgi:hypothetical protein